MAARRCASRAAPAARSARSARIHAQAGIPPDVVPVGAIATAVVAVAVAVAEAEAAVGAGVAVSVEAVVGVEVGAFVGASVFVGAGVGAFVGAAVGFGVAVGEGRGDTWADAVVDASGVADVPADGAAGDRTGLSVGAGCLLPLACGSAEAISPEHARRALSSAIRPRIETIPSTLGDRVTWCDAIAVDERGPTSSGRIGRRPAAVAPGRSAKAADIDEKRERDPQPVEAG